MSIPSAPQLLRRHAVPFTLAFAGLTAALIANYVSKRTWGPSRASVEAVLLAIPFTAAMTIPMAVLLAVLVWSRDSAGRACSIWQFASLTAFAA